MKRVLALFIAAQILSFNTSIVEADVLSTENDDIDGLRISCRDPFGNEIPGSHIYPGSGNSGGAIAGIAVGGAAAVVLGGMYVKDKLNYIKRYHTVGKFSIEDVYGSAYMQDSNKLASFAIKKMREENPNLDKFILVKNLDAKNGSLHIYNIKLPDEMIENTKKVKMKALFIADCDTDSINSHKLDFRLFNEAKDNKIAKSFVKSLKRGSGEYKIIQKLSSNEVESIENRKMVFIEKEYLLNTSKLKEGLTLAVSDYKHAMNEDYPNDYVLVLGIEGTHDTKIASR